MKPCKYTYLAPTSRAQMLEWKAEYGSDGRVIAGGQSLVPMMNFRLVAPSALIDLNCLPELAYIKESDGFVRVGAMTRYRTIEFSSLIADKLPLLAQAVKHVAHLPIRTRGTLGGSLAHADPAAEMPMVLLALDGSVRVESIQGSREIAAVDLFESMFTTSIEPDEVVTEIRFPQPTGRVTYGFEEVARRAGDFAIAAVAATLEMDGNSCRRTRVAIAGVETVQARLNSTERILEGQALTPAVIALAAKEAARSVTPQTDLHASAELRRHLLEVLCSRALSKAAGVEAPKVRHV